MIESVLRRDRVVVLAGLIGVAVLAWLYLFYLARAMPAMDMQPGDIAAVTSVAGAGMAMPAMPSETPAPTAMADMAMAPMNGEAAASPAGMDMAQMGAEVALPRTAPWTGLEFQLTVLMWSIMMVAMMLPSAAPMILSYATINRTRQAQQQPYTPTAVFALGYLAVWVSFSAVAASAQWLLHTASLLSPMLQTTSAVLAGTLLILAGLFQFSPLKQRCLSHCRTPFAYFLTHWRAGSGGAFRMGLSHGLYCLGCCWLLMVLLFVAGVMNLLWVAALAILVLLEKVTPAGPLISRIAGVIFLGWGVWLILGPWVGPLG